MVLIVTIVIECRATGDGAFTSVTAHDPEVVVEQFDFSKSGNHWREKVSGPVGARYFLTDITNSGRDQSAWHVLSGLSPTD